MRKMSTLEVETTCETPQEAQISSLRRVFSEKKKKAFKKGWEVGIKGWFESVIVSACVFGFIGFVYGLMIGVLFDKKSL